MGERIENRILVQLPKLTAVHQFAASSAFLVPSRVCKIQLTLVSSVFEGLGRGFCKRGSSLKSFCINERALSAGFEAPVASARESFAYSRRRQCFQRHMNSSAKVQSS